VTPWEMLQADLWQACYASIGRLRADLESLLRSLLAHRARGRLEAELARLPHPMWDTWYVVSRTELLAMVFSFPDRGHREAKR